jgi:cell division protease FtsH
MADFDEALRLHPQSAEARNGRGCALQCQEKFEEALAEFDEAIRLDPQFVRPVYNRGCVLAKGHEYELALTELDRAAQIDPDFVPIYEVRANCHYHLGHFAEAIADYSRCLPTMEQEASLWAWRGLAHFCLQDYEAAVRDLTQALQRDPKLAWAYEYRAKAWDEQGEHEKADADDQMAEALAALASPTQTQNPMKQTTLALLEKHFAPTPVDDITITERTFPVRVRADLQQAMDRLMSSEVQLLHFCGVRKRYAHEGIDFPELMIRDRDDAVLSVPPQYEQVHVGEAEPINCLKNGLWLLQEGDTRFAVFLEPEGQYSRRRGIRFQFAAANSPAGTQLCGRFFQRLDAAVQKSDCYRGKILSLEVQQDYGGWSTGITVHKLRTVDREQVILPKQTLELLERNVLRFVNQRPRLHELGLATKKGLLFYGPPGTGKTHTIHYLAGTLLGHTTLLIAAEQVGHLDEYMTLARLLQPSLVVIEDVDLIARDRARMHSPCEEVMLNKLLNEMDGLRQDANILFILTTNRPETLEAALASRPGRVDQAIEFPLPDAAGRAKLIRLYARGAQLSDELIAQTVDKTEHVSASFIKELLRRAMQFHLERSDSKVLELADIDSALEELLFTGGSLNRKLLGSRVGQA